MKKRMIVLTLSLAALAGCASTAGPAEAPTPTPSATPSSDETTESRRAQPRVVVSHEGGLLVLDARTFTPLTTLPAESFVRLSQAGDGRHVIVSEQSRFRVIDLGSWSQAHGDHAHHHVTSPSATEISFAAEKPGHVVEHHGLTALFDDGDGSIDVFDNAHLDKGAPKLTTVTVPAKHHGVAVPLKNGTIVHTVGTEEARSTIVVRDRSGKTLAQTDDCPGIHGEAVAKDDAVVFGCTDGVMVLRGTTFTKTALGTGYARSGNLSGSATSSVVLGDLKVDEKAKLERPTAVTLIDTTKATMRRVDLGASYTFRSLARGPQGEALVLTTDGKLTVINPDTGAITTRIPVIAPWSEPNDWTEARPLVKVSGKTAYVTEPATKSVKVIDLKTLTVTGTHDLGVVVNELEAVTG